jgi:hypothetical protein
MAPRNSPGGYFSSYRTPAVDARRETPPQPSEIARKTGRITAAIHNKFMMFLRYRRPILRYGSLVGLLSSGLIVA